MVLVIILPKTKEMMSSNVKNQKVNMNSIFWLKKKKKKNKRLTLSDDTVH